MAYIMFGFRDDCHSKVISDAIYHIIINIEYVSIKQKNILNFIKGTHLFGEVTQFTFCICSQKLVTCAEF